MHDVAPDLCVTAEKVGCIKGEGIGRLEGGGQGKGHDGRFFCMNGRFQGKGGGWYGEREELVGIQKGLIEATGNFALSVKNGSAGGNMKGSIPAKINSDAEDLEILLGPGEGRLSSGEDRRKNAASVFLGAMNCHHLTD